MKNFKIKAEDLKEIKTGLGYCFASDMITVDGKSVNYMYRENPDKEEDSGWRFFSGYEDDEYANNPENIEIYDVNTICNYSPDIVEFLEANYGIAYERDEKTRKFNEVDF